MLSLHERHADYVGLFHTRAQEYGVEVGDAEEHAIAETGERVVTRFLTRMVGDKLLSTLAEFEDETEPIPRYRRRQIANELRLPVERFIFGDQP